MLAEHVGHEVARHHALFCEEIEWAFSTPDARLVITAPPGSAKSRYATQLGPASWLSRTDDPERAKVLVGTHTGGMADEFGAKTRRVVRDNALVLGYDLAGDTAAKGRWNTTKDGEYYGVGVGMGISGIRAALGVLDDLYPSRQEADSKLFRDRVFAWLMDDFFQRLLPHAPVIAINTRWHDDDHIARLEVVWRAAKTPFRIVNLRAEAEDDDPLGREPGNLLGEDWAGWDYPSRIRQAKAEMSASGRAREYASLYQQKPVPDSGDFFRATWIVPVETLPPRSELRVYGASDYAVTDEGGDYTVHVVVGVDRDDKLYLLDVWRGQKDSFTWVQAWCDLVKKWKPFEWAEEQGQIKAGVGPFLVRVARQRQAFVARSQFPTRGDKAVRAQSIRGRMAMSGLHVPIGAPWRAEFESEILRFPAGVHDDQVDALGLIGQMLDRIQGLPKPEERRGPRPRRDWFDEPDDDGLNWKVA